MQTERDAEIVWWLGRIGAAGAEHVMGRFGMGRSWAYARLSRLVVRRAARARRCSTASRVCTSATAEGLRWCGLRAPRGLPGRPGGFEHARRSPPRGRAARRCPAGECSASARCASRERGEAGRFGGLGELPGGARRFTAPTWRSSRRTAGARGGGGAVGQGAAPPRGDLPRLRAGAPLESRLLPRHAAGGAGGRARGRRGRAQRTASRSWRSTRSTRSRGERGSAGDDRL